MDLSRSQPAGTLGTLGTLGTQLRRYRIAAGLTQEALADRSGISVYSISNLERNVGHIPRKETIELLADALQLSSDERYALAKAIGRAHPARGSQREAAVRERTSSHIPLPPTPLIGRGREVAALGALLQARTQPAGVGARVRLLTLVGPPGVGKTRLALEVANCITNAFQEGVAWVNLAPVGDARLVAGAIAQSLDIRQQGAEPMEALLHRHLQGKDVLLLLDNFEHVLPAAPFVADLLATCPKLHLLITSRAPLHVRGEYTFAVAPLATPDLPGLPGPVVHGPLEAPIHLVDVPSVALFIARAEAVLPIFALTPTNATEIAAICRRLDGLPLALELAVARLNVLSPAALLALLKHRLPILTGGPHDLPAHQQTLRGTLAWSYDLLAANEQTLFRRLAVFAGGAPLAAVAPVCYGGSGTDESGTDLLNSLSALLDHHLLMRMEEAEETKEMGGEPRYGMLETIREYAWEQLRLHDEATASERAHAEYYVALAEAAELKLRGPEQAEWLVRLEIEHDNLRAALRWSLADGAGRLALRFAASLSRFWMMRGYLSEGRAWLDEVLALVESEKSERESEHGDEAMYFALAQTLNGAGTLAHLQGDFTRATERYRQSLALRRRLGDRDRIAATLNNLGLVAYAQGEVERAAAWWQESMDLLGEDGDKRQAALALNHLGLFHRRRGEYRLARVRYQESLAKMRAVGDTRNIAQVVGSLGLLARDEGNYTEATTLLEESLDLHRALGDKQFMALCLCELGEVARNQGDLTLAQRLVEEGLGMLQALGDSEAIALALVYLGRLAYDRGDDAQAVARFMEALQLSMAHADRRSAILSLEGLASTACSRQHEEYAVGLFGAAAALREELSTPLPPVDRGQHDRLLADLRAELGDARFLAAWEAGGHLMFEEAAAEAMKEAGMAPVFASEPLPDTMLTMVPLHVRPQRHRDTRDGSSG